MAGMRTGVQPASAVSSSGPAEDSLLAAPVPARQRRGPKHLPASPPLFREDLRGLHNHARTVVDKLATTRTTHAQPPGSHALDPLGPLESRQVMHERPGRTQMGIGGAGFPPGPPWPGGGVLDLDGALTNTGPPRRAAPSRMNSSQPHAVVVPRRLSRGGHRVIAHNGARRMARVRRHEDQCAIASKA